MEDSSNFLGEGLDSGARQTNKNQSQARKFKLWGICLLISGLVFILIAFVMPFSIDSSIASTSLQLTALTEANEHFWRGTLSGNDSQQSGLEITRSHYLYNCTNVEDVMFQGAKPVYKEIGPFKYKEVNQYSDLVYN